MDSLSSQGLLAVQWTMVGVCTVAVAARLALRASRRTWSFWLSDVLLVLGVMCLTVLAILNVLLFSGMGPISDYSSPESAKAAYASLSLFHAGFYLPRFSLLAFYYTLFPEFLTRLRIYLHIITIYTVVCFLFCVFANLFWCGVHVSRGWALGDPYNCWIIHSFRNLLMNWAVGFSTEVLVFLLPLPILKKLKSLHKREKTGLLIIFMLGLLTIAVSITRMIMNCYARVSYVTFAMDNAESAVQILVVTLPALRPLLGVVRGESKAVFEPDPESAMYLSKISSNTRFSTRGSVTNYDTKEAKFQGRQKEETARG